MRHAAVGIVLAAVASSSLLAQEPPRFPAEVDRVRVEARVIGPGGKPVLDLRAQDFVLRVDGHVVPVESVHWIGAGMPDASDPESGSDMPWAPINCPLHRPGRYFSFCSSVPNVRIGICTLHICALMPKISPLSLQP